MSTYYYLVCDKHKEWTDVASRTAGGCCHLGTGDLTVPPFIVAHHKCSVRIVDEHSVDDWIDTYIKWTEENRKALIDAADIDGRWL